MRLILRTGIWVLIGVAAGLGLAGLLRAQAYLNEQAELHVARLAAQQQQLAGTMTPVAALPPSSLDSETTPLATSEIGPRIDTRPPALANEAKHRDEPLKPHRPLAPTEMLGEGKKAVAIRATDVDSLVEFLVPNQRIDVVLTRQANGDPTYNELVAQGARILAIDQPTADRNSSSPSGRSVLLEVDIIDSQKLLLASQLGTLSLVLSKEGAPRLQHTRRIGVLDPTEQEIAARENRDRFTPVQVFRARATPSVYNVPRE
jgi:Flp pilus assembly protein CpaB